MKKNICYSALIAIGLFAAGCAKDEGNYTYNNLSTKFVDETTLLQKLSFKQNEVININPGNVEGVNNANLEYEWRLVKEMYTPDPATGTYLNKQLATTKNLTYKFVDPFGNYVLILLVKDKANGGITQMVRKNISIMPFAMPGWMVLHGDGTSSDVNILVNDKITNSSTTLVVTTGTDSLQKNVYSTTNLSRLQGDGAGIYSAANSVGIFTKNSLGGFRLSSEDLSIKYNYDNLFMSPIPASDVQFQQYERNGANEVLVNKGDLYYMAQPTAGVFSKFGIKLFGKGLDDKALDFTAAPYISTNHSFSYLGAFYDTKNKRFLYINGSREIREFLNVPGEAFNARNVGKELVYSENGWETGTAYRTWFSIMQSQSDPNSREIFGLKLDASDLGTTVRASSRFSISSATEMNAAKYFAFGNKGPVMYYATDSKIYLYNLGTKTVTSTFYDISSAYPGNVITGMKLLKYAGHTNDGKLLYVALYNAATKAGTLLQFVVDPASGIKVGTEKAYTTGFGKISSMAYKPF